MTQVGNADPAVWTLKQPSKHRHYRSGIDATVRALTAIEADSLRVFTDVVPFVSALTTRLITGSQQISFLLISDRRSTQLTTSELPPKRPGRCLNGNVDARMAGSTTYGGTHARECAKVHTPDPTQIAEGHGGGAKARTTASPPERARHRVTA